MSEEVNEADVMEDDEDDEEMLARGGHMLASNGQASHTAYATAQLKDHARPTVEMDRVQITDPRDRVSINTTARFPEGIRAPAVTPPGADLPPLPVERQLVLANRVLNFVESIVPKRIADEEIGDAAEMFLRMVQRRDPPWRVYLKVATTVFWVLLHALLAAGRDVQRNGKV